MLCCFFACKNERIEAAKFDFNSVGIKTFYFGTSKFNVNESIIIEDKDDDPVIEFLTITGSDYDLFHSFSRRGLEYAVVVKENATCWPIKFVTVWDEEITINCPETKDEAIKSKTLNNGASLTIKVKEQKKVYINITSKDKKSVLDYSFHF